MIPWNQAPGRWGRALLLAASLAAGAAGCGGAEPHEEAAGEPEAGHSDAARGAVLLDTAAVAAAGIRTGPVESAGTSGLPVTGTITYAAGRVSHVGPRTAGRVATLRAAPGQRVRAGEVLAVLESPEVGHLRAEENQAAALLAIARENHGRERRLEEQGISSRKEVLEAEAELRRAQAALRSARERLQALGAAGGSGSRFSVTAPFSGTVVAREASPGEMAAPEDTLFVVADLSRVWIELDVFERDLARVRAGQRVDVATAAYPGRLFPGRIVHVGEVLDPGKRTVRARVEVPNPEGALKPGMFATARIQAGGGGPPSVAVPQEAVQTVEGRQVVFVPGARPGEFRAVPVQTGETLDGGRVVIRAGLKPGDRVVLAGAFSLRSELARGEIGEHGHGE
jgi:cobalt-zinc-cadmium efflux system membrane fusion protein